MNEVDCIVVGAGAVGLAIARAIARTGREVIIIERERHFGVHTSSRNSEVIHAGLHYEPGSLKARLCVRGRDMLYRYCAEHGIGHRRCGKLTLAASPEEVTQLEHIEKNARASEVLDLQWLSAAEVTQLEPQIAAHAALFSPSTGILDSHGYMQCLLGDAENNGANIVYGTAVSHLRVTPKGVEVCLDGEGNPSVRARTVVNCGGLFAAQLAHSIEGFPREQIPEIRYARGSYFQLSGRSPFTHLVYPAPPVGGHLGVHLTIDLAGGVRFGPDTQWIDAIDYAVDPSRAAFFTEAIRRYWPGLPEDRLRPAYAGIRPKLSKPGEVGRDFLISGPRQHGLAGVFNLFGIESPGLTASMALGELLVERIEAG